MKNYENPMLEITEIESGDVLTASFGELTDLDGKGTETPIGDWKW